MYKGMEQDDERVSVHRGVEHIPLRGTKEEELGTIISSPVEVQHAGVVDGVEVIDLGDDSDS